MKGNSLKTAGALLCIFLVSMGCANPSSGGHPHPENTLDRLILNDSNNQSIPGAEITLLTTDSNHTILGSTTTNAAGLYRLDFPSGQNAVDIYITADGFDDYFGDGWSASDWNSIKTIRLSPSTTQSTDYTTTVTGVITDEATGTGIEGAVVQAADTDTEHSESATTDATGHYLMTIIHDGDFTFSVEADGYYSETSPVVTTDTSSTQSLALLQRTSGTTFTTTVSGYIKDSETEAGIAHTVITLSDDDTQNSEFTTTNLDGYYSLTIIHDGDFTINASVSGYPDYESEITTTGSTMPWDVNLTTVITGSSYTTTIYGYIVDAETGAGIKDAYIVAMKNNDLDSFQYVQTGSDGYYFLTLTHNGCFFFGVQTDDYYIFEKEISTTEGSVSLNVDLLAVTPGLTFTTVVSGYILDEELDAGILNATVTVENETTQDSASTTTDSDGFYSLEITHDGEFSLSVDAPYYSFLQFDGIQAMAPTKTFNVYMESARTNFLTILSGYITDSDTGMGIENAWVEITNPESSFIYTVFADSEGYYSTEIDHYGEIILTASGPGYEEASSIEIMTTEDTYSQNVELTPIELYTTTVSGYVTNSITGDAVDSVSIIANEYDYDIWDYDQCYSESNGYYSVTIIHDGDFDISSYPYGYEDYGTSITTTSSTVSLDIALTPDPAEPIYTTTFSGTITDEDTGTGIYGAMITFTDSEKHFWYTTTTDADGNYSVDVIHRGDLIISATSFGYESFSAEISTTAGTYSQNIQISNLVKYTTTVSGHVTDSDSGTALESILIQLYDPDIMMGTSIYTDSDGYYEIRFYHDGEFTLSANSHGYESFETTVSTTEPTFNQDIEIAEDPSEISYTTTVSGTITDSETDAGINSATIYLSDSDTGHFVNTKTEADGSFSLSIAHDGYFSFAVDSRGYEYYETDITTTDSEYTQNGQLDKMQEYATTISGVITDANTGEAINGAYILPYNYIAETVDGIYADETGSYSVTITHYGYYSLWVSYARYEPQDLYFETIDSQNTVNIELEESP